MPSKSGDNPEVIFTKEQQLALIEALYTKGVQSENPLASYYLEAASLLSDYNKSYGYELLSSASQVEQILFPRSNNRRCNLYFMSSLPSIDDKLAKGSYLWITSTNNNDHLYYIHDDGEQEKVKISNVLQFQKQIQEITDSNKIREYIAITNYSVTTKKVVSLSRQDIEDIVIANVGFPPSKTVNEMNLKNTGNLLGALQEISAPKTPIADSDQKTSIETEIQAIITKVANTMEQKQSKKIAPEKSQHTTIPILSIYSVFVKQFFQESVVEAVTQFFTKTLPNMFSRKTEPNVVQTIMNDILQLEKRNNGQKVGEAIFFPPSIEDLDKKYRLLLNRDNKTQNLLISYPIEADGLSEGEYLELDSVLD